MVTAFIDQGLDEKKSALYQKHTFSSLTADPDTSFLGSEILETVSIRYSHQITKAKVDVFPWRM